MLHRQQHAPGFYRRVQQSGAVDEHDFMPRLPVVGEQVLQRSEAWPNLDGDPKLLGELTGQRVSTAFSTLNSTADETVPGVTCERVAACGH